MSTGSTREWQGLVIEVNGDLLTVELCREGAPDLIAEYSMTECGLSGIEPGDVLAVTRDSVSKLDLGVWTEKDLDEIRERAREQYEQISRSWGGAGEGG